MPTAVLGDAESGYISRYALGRDYHKVMRGALARLAKELAEDIGPFGYRVCVDSAPVLEKALARNAGLGWIGKHTNLISREAGSWFFLGEILTDLPLPEDEPASAHCGTCTACITACPTEAIVAPYRLDARRCIAYLTIEHHSAIPVELRPAIGNRIYGCDDCQLVCPWNKFAHAASHPDFKVRHGLDSARLTELFGWTEAQFEERMRGSAIYRIGYEKWSRNIAVALGNAPTSERWWRRWSGGGRVLRSWCASTSSGHWHGTGVALSGSRAHRKMILARTPQVHPCRLADRRPGDQRLARIILRCALLLNVGAEDCLSGGRGRGVRQPEPPGAACRFAGVLRSSARRTEK